jgi:hypothetical protein
MQVVLDAPGNATSHGYTKDNDGTLWYWAWDCTTGTLRFRESGTPTDHPEFRSFLDEVPADARVRLTDAQRAHLLDRPPRTGRLLGVTAGPPTDARCQPATARLTARAGSQMRHLYIK